MPLSLECCCGMASPCGAGIVWVANWPQIVSCTHRKSDARTCRESSEFLLSDLGIYGGAHGRASSFDPRPAKLGRNVSERSLRSRIVFADGRKAATSAVPKPELKGRNLASLQRGLFLRLPGVGISASSLALDLKSKARTLRISWSNAMPVAPSRA
jgi:hypothetical protein